jgi:hypothetical protein
MLSSKGFVYIDITNNTDRVVYTNRKYRLEHNKNNNYVDGIHKALWEEFGSLLSYQIDENSYQLYSNVIKDVLGYNTVDQALRTGIGAQINDVLADEIAERATKYCPEDTGKLKNSIRVVHNNDGTAYIVYDCEYAWFVHEFVWKSISRDKNPFAIHKWLEVAIQEVYKEHGLL